MKKQTIIEKKTKIVCTVGPATESAEMLAKLVDAGMNVMRLNFSHGDFAEHQPRVDRLRAIMKKTGKNLALVSDAGTPGISDPGSELLRRIRQELANEIKSGEVRIETIPGPSALTAALSIAGVPCTDFTFLGFLPHKKGRETLFREIAASERTVVFYESPHRIMKTLESLGEHLNGGSAGHEPAFTPKLVTICRELTKVFEEVVQGTAKEVRDYFEEHADKVKGEFVVIVSAQ